MSSISEIKQEPDNFEDLEDLTELLNRAQAIIDENRQRMSRTQALAVLSEPPIELEESVMFQPPVPESRPPNNDDDVIFVACEQNSVIDLRTPDTTSRHKRRRRQNVPIDNLLDVTEVPITTTNPDVSQSTRRNANINCPICLDDCQKATSTLCGHVFCEKCIKAAIRATQKCPLCKRKLSPKAIHPVYF